MTDNNHRTYRVQVIPVDGYRGDYPPYVWVNANTTADAVSEARAYLRIKGLVSRNFELKVKRDIRGSKQDE